MTDIDLQTYCNRAVEKGVSDAKQIHPSSVVTAVWVRLKCQFGCANYSWSFCCPPHVTGDYQKAKEYLNAYERAIVFRINIPGVGLKYITGPFHIEAIRNKEYNHIIGSILRYVSEKGDMVERAAFYDGHYFAVSCHYGPCLYEYCETFKFCQEIENGKYRFPYRARPSVEQFFSIDLIKLADQLGWENYMVGPCAFPQDFHKDYQPYFLGLVLVT